MKTKKRLLHTLPKISYRHQNMSFALKREFFKRRRLSVFGCLTKLEEVIKYYSSIHIIFHSLPKYQERLQKLSFDYTTESFVKINKYTYEVCSRYLIKLNNNSCSCWYFSKWGICKHAVAFSNIYGLSWFGDKYRIERSKFHTLLKKDRPSLATNAWVSD